MLPGLGDSEEEAKSLPFMGVHRGETSNEPLTTPCSGRSPSWWLRAAEGPGSL